MLLNSDGIELCPDGQTPRSIDGVLVCELTHPITGETTTLPYSDLPAAYTWFKAKPPKKEKSNG